MDHNFDVTVVGNVGIDTNVYLKGPDIDFDIESNYTENLDTIGQAGGYACLGYSQLNVKTAFIGYIGDDYQGEFIRQRFQDEQIETKALFIDPTGTARSINFMYKDGRRKNFYDGKDHLHLQPDLDICQQVLENTRLAHFSLPNWAHQTLPIAKELGVKIACDIQDVVNVDDPYRQDFISHADILFFSAVNQSDLSGMIEEFMRRDPQQIIIAGMGPHGCALGARQTIRYFEPIQMQQPVVDTNGAGDSLAVGFLTSFLLGSYSLEDSILRGQIAARHTCTLRGTSKDLITPEQMEAYAHR